jgi:hypothetical protein
MKILKWNALTLLQKDNKKKGKFALEQAMKAQTGGAEVYLYYFFNLGARLVRAVNTIPRPLYPQERYPVPIVQEAGWIPEPVWTNAKNLAPIGIRSSGRPARRESK